VAKGRVALKKISPYASRSGYKPGLKISQGALVRTFLFFALVLTLSAACSKSEAPLQVAPEAPAPAPAPEASAVSIVPAMPATGIDIHQIPAGDYKLVKLEVFSNSKFREDSDYSAIYAYDVKKNELKVSQFEFNHPRNNGHPFYSTLPMTLETNGTEAFVSESLSTSVYVSLGNEGEISLNPQYDSKISFVDGLASMKLNSAGIYENDKSKTGGYRMIDRVTATVEGDTVVIFIYNREISPVREGAESLTRYTFEKQAFGTIPAVPKPGASLYALPEGKFELHRVRAYTQEGETSLALDYSLNGDVVVLHHSGSTPAPLYVEYPKTIKSNFDGKREYGTLKGLTIKISEDGKVQDTTNQEVMAPETFIESVQKAAPSEGNVYRNESTENDVTTVTELTFRKTSTAYVFYQYSRAVGLDAKILSEKRTELHYKLVK